MTWLTMTRWSPYAVGAGIGLLSCLTFLLSDKPLGCSTAFARTSGMLEKIFRGRKTLEQPYYQQFPPVVDWEWMLVLGLIAGAFVSALISHDFSFIWVPQVWRSTVGDAAGFRWLIALSGGIILGFGSRWANGCTSGHGISGTLQLALSSWLAAVCFFIGGIASAMLLLRVIF